MELILQKELPHQQKAIDAICSVFDGVRITAPTKIYENPGLDLSDLKLLSNIQEVQKQIPQEYRIASIGDFLNLDIKMETGTGKTYVYTKAIFELNKRCGINKFIIAVPSLAIKAGTAQFISDSYVRKHFSYGCGYDTEIELEVLNAPKNKKKGRTYFPSVVSDFIKGSCQNTRKIYVLLVNMQILTSNTHDKKTGRDMGLLWRNDYDYGAEGFYRPYDAIRATKPFVIIDEPHRFSRNQQAYKAIVEQIKPQCIIRFGATFPETTTGRGKKRVTVKDYQNLLYDLDACKAFNQGLVKGVAKEHFEPTSKKDEKVKITSIDNSRKIVHFQLKQKIEATKTFELGKGDALSIISNDFEGITITAISANSVEFSNGIIKNVGEEMDVDIYMTSYQEQMIRLALQRHFETERENFCNRRYKIKTLALFFIDDISSYRKDEDGKTPYLLEAFERILKEQIEEILDKLTASHEQEYKAYLEASLNDISACHAGYFAQDNDDSDEKIAEEVKVILHGKKELLSFKRSDGRYNTLRFLFSKWTLKEGWDNPNVFTIAKLRSSGSEISKLQEVGRGLRLPVDENGNRISNEDFTLNYIVDFTEADFADKLVREINGDVPQASIISREKLNEVAKKMGLDPNELFKKLILRDFIDMDYNINATNRAGFFEEYPDFATGLAEGKVKDKNKTQSKIIKIRPKVFSKLKELWEKINQRYFLYYEDELNNLIHQDIVEILEKPEIFSDVVLSSERTLVRSNGMQMSTETTTGVQYVVFKPMPYNVFLKRIMNVTNIPITVLHQGLCNYSKKHGAIKKEYFNESTVAAFCNAFHDWKMTKLQGHFQYKKGGNEKMDTALTYADGSVKTEIAQGRIGTKFVEGTPSDKYLYNTYAYDSPLEKQNILSDISSVIVYGKIPRRSIAIPTITGETYSPDFMYVVERSSGEKELNIIVETKDVENKSTLRDVEDAKIKCAEQFFKALSNDGYKVYFKTQLNNREMTHIINDVLRCES